MERVIADPEEPRPEGGRHRGPRKPAFRAAVPVAAVLAAGGGALALIHATGAGASSSQAMDMASEPPGSAVTTDLTNAPASVDAKATPLSTSGSATIGESPAAQTEPLSSTGGWSQALVKLTPHGSPDPAGTVITGQATIQPSGAPSPTLPVQGPGSFSTPSLPGFTTTSSASAAGSPSTPPPPTTPPTPPTPTTPPSTDPSSPPSTPPSSVPPPTGTPSPTGPPSPSGSASQPPVPSGTATTASSSPAPIPPQTRILQSGDTGPDVSDLQTRLDRLVAPPWLPVTGVYDARTARAVAHLQQQLNITGDPVGIFGPNTYTRLMELTTGNR